MRITPQRVGVDPNSATGCAEVFHLTAGNPVVNRPTCDADEFTRLSNRHRSAFQHDLLSSSLSCRAHDQVLVRVVNYFVRLLRLRIINPTKPAAKSARLVGSGIEGVGGSSSSDSRVPFAMNVERSNISYVSARRKRRVHGCLSSGTTRQIRDYGQRPSRAGRR